eukprot:1945006-Prymnesium_polylepis.2
MEEATEAVGANGGGQAAARARVERARARAERVRAEGTANERTAPHMPATLVRVQRLGAQRQPHHDLSAVTSQVTMPHAACSVPGT